MPELRWILIGFAIVLLAGIYLWGRRASKAAASDDALLRVRPEPALHVETTLESPPHSPDTQDYDAATGARDDVPERIELAPAVDDWRPSARGVDTMNTGSHERSSGSTGDTWRGRVEPTFFEDAPTEELRVELEPTLARSATGADARAETPAPTLSSSDAPPPRRIERRKVIALRLSCTPHRVDGGRLLEAFAAESLQHGKYDVFHRLHENGSIVFSIASMVEPGTFDLEKMPQTQYPGVTLFAQLPGPVAGMHAVNELVACARRLQQSLGGTLQDERGVPLTVHRIERIRQEVREFERPPSGASRGSGARPQPQ